MDNEKIRKALDHFENDEFTDAKEILQPEIRTARDEYLNTKLGLEEIDKVEEQEEEEDKNKKKKKNGEEDEDENEDED